MLSPVLLAISAMDHASFLGVTFIDIAIFNAPCA
jgi:hypothetical protein